MRLVSVTAPKGKGVEVARLALDAGISRASVHEVQIHTHNGDIEIEDVVEISSSTPQAKAFVDALMSAPLYEPGTYSITIRQPLSVVSKESPLEVTRPVVVPTVDILEDLWQFSHLTFSFVGRFFIGALLLSYGMIQSNLLLIIAGLLFMPFLPLLLAVGFGLWTREWRLAGQGIFALLVATSLTAVGSIVVALMTGPPLRFEPTGSLLASFLISLAIGVAASLATADDVGRRELIGLAATSQVALIPAWLGITSVFGFSPLAVTSPVERIVTFFLVTGTVISSAFITYALLRMRGVAVRHFTSRAIRKN